MKKNSAGLQLESANFSNGVIYANVSNNRKTEVNYFLKDHLGSTRTVIDSLGNVIERNDYYPFGARYLKGQYLQKGENRFKYNGKEEQVIGNLDFLDYEARMYDNKLARWTTTDPLSESSPGISPYSYCNNNPIMYIDPNGEKISFYWYEDMGNGTATRHSGFRNSTVEYLWEMFARTDAGFKFLSLYASKGDKIGSIEFHEDGPLSYFNIEINDFDYLGKLGSFRLDFLYKNKKFENNDVYFTVEISSINISRKTDLEGRASYLVTLGHEMFIHMEQWHIKYIVSFLKNDKKEFDRLISISSKDGGNYDHSEYINGNERFKTFNNYLRQLKAMDISPLTPELIDNAKKNMMHCMKISRKILRIASSVILCWACNSSPTASKPDRVYYYLESCKERNYMTRYSARIYIQQKDDRVLERVYVYNDLDDTVTIRQSRQYRRNGQTLVSYTSPNDFVGQIYLKVQPDTSFVFAYEDSGYNHLMGSEFSYLGKDSLQRGGKIREFYKFKELRQDTEFIVYLDNDFILERLEWMIENYLHCSVQRLDSCQVPKGLIDKMRKINLKP